MKMSEVELPSNKKFGLFFTFVFMLGAGYFYSKATFDIAYGFVITAVITFLLTMLKPHFLLPLNKLWMRFGLLLGMIVNPFVLGIIFFGIFTPIAFIMKLYGRDELRLKFRKKNTHWISRDQKIQTDSLKNQL